MSDTILDEQIFENPILRRRDLLPKWIKVFLWIFLIFGAIAPIALICGILGFGFVLSLYGLTTSEPISVIGGLIIFLFAFKGITAFGLWSEKEWAVKMAIIDAVLGIIICVYVMAFYSQTDNGYTLNFKFELFLLVPYLFKMRKIKNEWHTRTELKKNL